MVFRTELPEFYFLLVKKRPLAVVHRDIDFNKFKNTKGAPLNWLSRVKWRSPHYSFLHFSWLTKWHPLYAWFLFPTVSALVLKVSRKLYVKLCWSCAFSQMRFPTYSDLFFNVFFFIGAQPQFYICFSDFLGPYAAPAVKPDVKGTWRQLWLVLLHAARKNAPRDTTNDTTKLKYNLALLLHSINVWICASCINPGAFLTNIDENSLWTLGTDSCFSCKIERNYDTLQVCWKYYSDGF